MVNYNLVRSKRKTIGIYVKNGVVEVRAPLKAPRSEIDKWVKIKEKWIEEHLQKQSVLKAEKEKFTLGYNSMILYKGIRVPLNNLEIPSELSPEQIKYAVITAYKALAKMELAGKVRRFSEIMSLKPNAVKITSAKTRWGSCSAKGNINFSWRLIMADDDVIDYVVVHELAHIKELNHSPKFWAVVRSVLPDYKERQKRLKELQRRLATEDWD